MIYLIKVRDTDYFNKFWNLLFPLVLYNFKKYLDADDPDEIKNKKHFMGQAQIISYTIFLVICAYLRKSASPKL